MPSPSFLFLTALVIQLPLLPCLQVEWCRACACETKGTDDSHVVCTSPNGLYAVTQPLRTPESNFIFQCLHHGDASFPTDLRTQNFSLGDTDELQLYRFSKCTAPETLSELTDALGISRLRGLMLDGTEDKPMNLSEGFFSGATDLKRIVFHDKYFKELPYRLFRHVPNLRKLNFSHTNLRRLPSLQWLDRLEDLNIEDTPIERLDLDQNKLLHLNLNRLNLTSVSSELLRNLVNLRTLEWSFNQVDEIPPNLFESINRLEKIVWHFDGCRTNRCIRKIPELNVPSLHTFSYSAEKSIQKVQFPKAPFKNVLKLSSLQIEQANLSTSDLRDLELHNQQHLEFVSLVKNNLTLLTVDLLPPNFTLLTLSNNPFSCDCETINTLTTHKLESKIPEIDFKNTKVFCPHPTGLTVAKSTFCNHKAENKKLIVIVVVVVVLLVLLVTLFLASICNEKIRIRMYKNNLFSLLFPTQNHETKYDAFISYAEADMPFIERVLRPGLETGNEHNQRRFTCCIHHRDWLPGGEIANNIISSVEDSARTIIILSDHFLHSPWCQVEFVTAYKRNKIIVIMRTDPQTGADAVSERELDRHPVVREYIETYTYLKESDEDFWAKLTYHLPHKAMERQNAGPKNKRRRRTTELQSLINRLNSNDSQTSNNVNHV